MATKSKDEATKSKDEATKSKDEATKSKDEGFPDTLLGFGYEFSDGKLKHVKTGEPFQFVVREGNHSYNQKHYEAMGEVITEEVYKLLESECSLKRSPVPTDPGKKPSTFIFMSDDALDNPDKLLVLIHGSGVVRAGQWARRLIINDNLDSGTQIPFIKEAQKEGYGILVMNTNDNSRKVERLTVTIKASSDPESHAIYVWKKYVRKAKAKHIALIAHSFGGCVTTTLFQNEKDDFSKRVFAVAMTDSVHYISKPSAFKNLVKISRNWVSSLKPLDTPLSTMTGDIKRVSAGVDVHEQTSWCSFKSVFKFLQKRYDVVTKDETEDPEEEKEKEDEDSQEVALDRSMSIETTSDDLGPEEPAPVEGDTQAHAMSESDDEGDQKNKPAKMDE